MRKASIVAPAFSNNALFDLNGPLNRDDCLLPYAKLRTRFLEAGVELNTADLNASGPVCFEIHLDAQIATPGPHPRYAVLMETPMIHPGNADARLLASYKRLFTWDDDRVDGQRFHKINFPNPLRTSPVDGYAGRQRLCVMISANKSVRRRDARELYTARTEAIQWFERHAPEDFVLYGLGWDMPFMRSGLWGKALGRWWRLTAPYRKPVNRPSYRGAVQHKAEVLGHSRFALCYENAQGYRGYITEKLFDCFLSGCVPVYWGADNIHDHIPAMCFIDRRQFADLGELHRHLKNMPEAEYLRYQAAIAQFLQSDQAWPFGADFFVNTLFDTISRDLHVAA